MQHPDIIRCVLSGSFRNDSFGLEKAYLELATCGCQVLSPHRMQFIEKDNEFMRDKAENNLDEKTIEMHHLTSIQQADFLWIHMKDGYIGRSTALEIGYALSLNRPIFASSEPTETLFKQFIIIVPSVFEAIQHLRNLHYIK